MAIASNAERTRQTGITEEPQRGTRKRQRVPLDELIGLFETATLDEPTTSWQFGETKDPKGPCADPSEDGHRRHDVVRLGLEFQEVLWPR